MKIVVTGTRGMPDIPGGVEKHCQELYPRLSALGHDICVLNRSPYVTSRDQRWRGVDLKCLYAPRVKSLEAITHTFLAVLAARRRSPDILHVHSVGPGMLVPFARILGLKVVFTSHGPDYCRQKWGFASKAMLRLGEFLGGKYANEVIVVSRLIGDIIAERCGRDSHLIHNGASLPTEGARTDFLEKMGIQPGGYVLGLARFVPEKELERLARAFARLPGDRQLVIAGDANYSSSYSRRLKRMIDGHSRMISTGFITGERLHQVMSHASLFVLPSYYEGLSLALLEALSYGLPLLVSDIPANKEVGLPKHRYFRCGDEDDLLARMETLLQQGISNEEKEDERRMVAEKYNWDHIAMQTLAVYEKALAK